MPAFEWTESDIKERLLELGQWFHNIDLRGVPTAPQHFLGDYPAVKWQAFQHSIPPDLRGKTVLDIGCNGGFYSMEMKRRGAERVVGVDSDPDYLAQAKFAAQVHGMEIDFLQCSVYDLRSLQEQFDIVLFMGVLYHLRHPLYVLDLIHDYVSKDLLIFQSMQRGSRETLTAAEDYAFSDESLFQLEEAPKLHFVERNYAGDCTNWWIPNRACVEAMLRSSGFAIEQHPEQEVYVCRRQPGRSQESPQQPDAVSLLGRRETLRG